jgi:hypothetical protein
MTFVLAPPFRCISTNIASLYPALRIIARDIQIDTY